MDNTTGCQTTEFDSGADSTIWQTILSWHASAWQDRLDALVALTWIGRRSFESMLELGGLLCRRSRDVSGWRPCQDRLDALVVLTWIKSSNRRRMRLCRYSEERAGQHGKWEDKLRASLNAANFAGCNYTWLPEPRDLVACRAVPNVNLGGTSGSQVADCCEGKAIAGSLWCLRFRYIFVLAGRLRA